MSRRPAERRTQHAVMATASEWARIRELAAAADMDGVLIGARVRLILLNCEGSTGRALGNRALLSSVLHCRDELEPEFSGLAVEMSELPVEAPLLVGADALLDVFLALVTISRRGRLSSRAVALIATGVSIRASLGGAWRR